MSTPLPPSWSLPEVCEQWNLSPAAIEKLIRDGKVGYFTAKRQKRFFVENIAQIRSAVEVTPKVADDVFARIGASKRRRSA